MREERRAIRALIHELTPEQWDTPSLCAGWTVRDVVAHLLAWDDLLIYRTGREHLRVMVRFWSLYASSLASMRMLNRRLQSRTRACTTDDLIRRFATEDSPDLKWLFDGSNRCAHYAEYVIHHEDIRRPLGLTRDVPPDRLAAAMTGVTRLPGVRMGARRRQRRIDDNTLDGLLALAGRRAG
jgi:uncharacterized protein (TIGR03083 family)